MPYDFAGVPAQHDHHVGPVQRGNHEFGHVNAPPPVGTIGLGFGEGRSALYGIDFRHEGQTVLPHKPIDPLAIGAPIFLPLQQGGEAPIAPDRKS